jgi:chromosome segregation ATPase
MSEPMHFRSAFNGFNREDVVHYIEYLNANHENQIKQLQADLAAVQKESLLAGESEDQSGVVAEMQEQFAQQEAILTALNAEKDELIAKCAQLEAALADLAAENAALTEKAARLEAQLANAPVAAAAVQQPVVSPKPQMSSYMEEELAAYRRAERVERLANERAATLYRKLRSALQDTASQADAAVSNLDNITDQFNALRDSLADSKSSLEQSLSSLSDICPVHFDD